MKLQFDTRDTKPKLRALATLTALAAGAVFIFLFDYAVSGSQREVMLHDLITNLFAAMYLYFECMLLGVIVADAIAAKHEPHKDKDCIIILGCALKPDGTPTPLLRGRLDRALAFAQAQTAQTGKALILGCMIAIYVGLTLLAYRIWLFHGSIQEDLKQKGEGADENDIQKQPGDGPVRVRAAGGLRAAYRTGDPLLFHL